MIVSDNLQFKTIRHYTVIKSVIYNTKLLKVCRMRFQSEFIALQLVRAESLKEKNSSKTCSDLTMRHF